MEIDVDEVKNDMANRIVIDSTITISPKTKFKPGYEATMKELGSIE